MGGTNPTNFDNPTHAVIFNNRYPLSVRLGYMKMPPPDPPPQQNGHKHIFLITGFGPFKHHLVNPSSTAVEYLMAKYATQPVFHNVNLEFMPCIKVAYAHAHKQMTDRFCHHPAPSLVLHIGVGSPNAFCFEQVACNLGYFQADVTGQYVNEYVANMKTRPANRHDPLITPELAFHARAIPDARSQYESRLVDLDKMQAHLLEQNPDWNIKQSSDAGQYLCDFIYTTSMYLSTTSDRCSHRVLFLHVPPVGHPYSQEQINLFVDLVVQYLIQQSQ